MALKHLRSSTANKRPQASGMSDGQLALNTASGSPGMFFKDNAGSLVKVGPVHVGSGAPNASPASGGTTGNSIGEQWLDTTGGTYVFKVWDGTAWRSETGTFVDAAGDVMTGALGIIAGTAAAPGLYVSGDSNTGIYSPGADQLAISTGGTGRLFVDSAGNIGIGTSTTSTRLRVVGTPQSTSDYFNNTIASFESNTSDGLAVVRTASTTIGLKVNSERNFVFGIEGSAGAFTERLRITSDGKVGIGTSSPGYQLEVNSGATDATSLFNSTAATGSHVRFGRSGTVDGYVGCATGFLTSGTSAGDFGIRSQGALVLGTGGNNNRLHVTSDGKVGIGTSSPGFPLDVVSVSGESIRMRGASGTDISKLLFTSNSAGTDYGYLSAGSGYLGFGYGASERARLDSSGRLLVGASSSSAFTTLPQLVIQGTSVSDPAIWLARNVNASSIGSGDMLGNIAMGSKDGGLAAQIKAEGDGTWSSTSDCPGRLVFSTTADGAASPTERLRITSDGKVGIGTSSPSCSLDVNGTIRGVGSAGTLIASNGTGSGQTSILLRREGATTDQKQFEILQGSSGEALFRFINDTYANSQDFLSAYRGSTYTVDNVRISTNGSERLRVDSFGRLLVGTSSYVQTNTYSAGNLLNIAGGSGSGLQLSTYSADTFALSIDFSKSRGATVGTQTVVQSGDALGSLLFNGYDGAAYKQAAAIQAVVDGTPGTNDMPGRLVFSTTADGASSPTERMVIKSDGKVGIGTSSPTSKLHVNGNSAANNLLVGAGGTAFSIYNNDSTGEIRLSSIDTTSTNLKFITFYTNPAGSSNGTERLRITSDGSVGIGTSAPAAGVSLEVVGVIRAQSGGNIVDLTSDGSIELVSSSGPRIDFKTSGTEDFDCRIAQVNDGFAIQTGGNGSTGERLRVTSDGKVGIGTSSPSYDLSFGSGTSNLVSIGTTDAALRLRADGARTLQFYTNSAEAMRINSAGLVGIGTSSPSYLLEVSRNTAGDAAAFTASADRLRPLIFTSSDNTASGAIWTRRIESAFGVHAWSINGTERLRITSDGKVGINTTSPSDSLTVAGSISLNSRGNTFSYKLPDWRIYNSSSGNALVVDNYTTEAFRVDSSNRLLVGTSSTSSEAKLLVQGGSTGSGAALHLQRNVTTASAGSTIGYIRFANSSDNPGATIIAEGDGTWTAGTSHPTRIVFSTTADGASSPTERMRISSSGWMSLKVGTATVGTAGNMLFQPDGNATNVPFTLNSGNSSSSTDLTYAVYSTSLTQYQFYVGYNGTVYARNTSISSLSDEREKENIRPLETGLPEIMALQPRRFDWKNGSGVNIAGFIAQEVEDILPDLIDEYKINEAQTRKALKMGDIIPTLVKAVQEQQAIISELQAKVAALEAS